MTFASMKTMATDNGDSGVVVFNRWLNYYLFCTMLCFSHTSTRSLTHTHTHICDSFHSIGYTTIDIYVDFDCVCLRWHVGALFFSLSLFLSPFCSNILSIAINTRHISIILQLPCENETHHWFISFHNIRQGNCCGNGNFFHCAITYIYIDKHI